ncbi:MAG: thioredoxin domain-containing protein, partial [Crocinitomicaceae bacterium]
KIDGVLEDYTFVIKAFIELYQVTFEEKWMELAKNLTLKVESNFQDSNTKMCYYTSLNTELIARKMELNDNVIPASNSVMAHNFHKLSYFYRNPEWKENAKQMLANIYDGMEMYGSGYSNWALLLLQFIESMEEIEIVGLNASKIRQNENKKFKIGTIYSGGVNFSLPILHEKTVTPKTILYRCKGEICDAPIEFD